jgi:chromosome partitioning protein
MSHVIAIANQKGGVGKTTTAVNLSASLAAAEKRVLMIDMDPQANATSGLGVQVGREDVTLYDVLVDRFPIADATRTAVHFPTLDVIPSSPDVAGIEANLVRVPRREQELRTALGPIRKLYDFVVIDCPPAMGLLTLNALVAADSVLIPLQPEYFALEGLSRFTELLREICQHLNPRLRILGILPTMYDGRINLAREVVGEAEAYFPAETFRTRIPRNVRLAEAPSFGKPALVYDINSAGAQAYLKLAAEVIASTRAFRTEREPALA